MKYIKLFEDIVVDNQPEEILFKRVEYPEFDEFTDKFGPDTLTTQEMKTLGEFKKILVKKNKVDLDLRCQHKDGKWSCKFISEDGKRRGYKATSHQIFVYRYEDDWYSIIYRYVDIPTPTDSHLNYYKCDTFEGLIQCLKYLGLE
jgi:hypothetical protein